MVLWLHVTAKIVWIFFTSSYDYFIDWKYTGKPYVVVAGRTFGPFQTKPEYNLITYCPYLS